MSWNDERIELLKKLWIDGLSSSQIGAALGITRNAAIGKIHRLGIHRDLPRVSSPSSSGRPSRPRTRVRAARIVAAAARASKPLPPEPKPVANLVIAATMILGPGRTLMELTENTCRYPVGNPSSPDFLFCGALADGPYCQVHSAVCYYTPSRR